MRAPELAPFARPLFLCFFFRQESGDKEPSDATTQAIVCPALLLATRRGARTATCTLLRGTDLFGKAQIRDDGQPRRDLDANEAGARLNDMQLRCMASSASQSSHRAGEISCAMLWRRYAPSHRADKLCYPNYSLAKDLRGALAKKDEEPASTLA